MILYSKGGVPTAVPPSLVKDYLLKGYSKKKPSPPPKEEEAFSPEPTKHTSITFIDDHPEEPTQELPPPNNEVTRVYDVDKLKERPLTPLTEKQVSVLNYWSLSQLEGLKGVGEATAKKIKQNRPFVYLEELKNIAIFGGWGKILADIEENVHQL